uniref:DUF4939 domain-containing protein n=1 Tax=Amphiprion ocellaris TaxID=80972 RepID=A0AAQ5Z028_AMPOC
AGILKTGGDASYGPANMSSSGNEIVVDGAASITIEQAIVNQNSALGQHEEMLRSLISSNTALYNQPSTLTERVTRLARHSSLPAPVVVPAPIVNQVVPVKEPHVPLPERYSGDFGSCQSFLTQPQSYASDQAKIAFLIGLSGAARDWGTGVWGQQSPTCNSYTVFVAEMKIFDHPVRGRDAADRILSTTQGTQSVAEYAMEFRMLASEIRWNNEALRGQGPCPFVITTSGPMTVPLNCVKERHIPPVNCTVCQNLNRRLWKITSGIRWQQVSYVPLHLR